MKMDNPNKDQRDTSKDPLIWCAWMIMIFAGFAALVITPKAQRLLGVSFGTIILLYFLGFIAFIITGVLLSKLSNSSKDA